MYYLQIFPLKPTMLEIHMPFNTFLVMLKLKYLLYFEKYKFSKICEDIFLYLSHNKRNTLTLGFHHCDKLGNSKLCLKVFKHCRIHTTYKKCADILG